MTIACFHGKSSIPAIMSGITGILKHKNGLWVVKEKIASQCNNFDAWKLRRISKNNESLMCGGRCNRLLLALETVFINSLHAHFQSIYRKELLMTSNLHDFFFSVKSSSFFLLFLDCTLFQEIRTEQYSPMSLSQFQIAGMWLKVDVNRRINLFLTAIKTQCTFYF